MKAFVKEPYYNLDIETRESNLDHLYLDQDRRCWYICGTYSMKKNEIRNLNWKRKGSINRPFLCVLHNPFKYFLRQLVEGIFQGEMFSFVYQGTRLSNKQTKISYYKVIIKDVELWKLEIINYSNCKKSYMVTLR